MWISYCSTIIILAGIFAIIFYSKNVKKYKPLIISFFINLIVLLITSYFIWKKYNNDDWWWLNGDLFFSFSIKNIILFFWGSFFAVKDIVLSLISYDYWSSIDHKAILLLILTFGGLFLYKKKNYLFLVLPIFLTMMVSSMNIFLPVIGRTLLFIFPFCYILSVYIFDVLNKKYIIILTLLLSFIFYPVFKNNFKIFSKNDINFFFMTKEFLNYINKTNPYLPIYHASGSVIFYNISYNNKFNIIYVFPNNTEITFPCYIMLDYPIHFNPEFYAYIQKYKNRIKRQYFTDEESSKNYGANIYYLE